MNLRIVTATFLLIAKTAFAQDHPPPIGTAPLFMEFSETQCLPESAFYVPDVENPDESWAMAARRHMVGILRNGFDGARDSLPIVAARGITLAPILVLPVLYGWGIDELRGETGLVILGGAWIPPSGSFRQTMLRTDMRLRVYQKNQDLASRLATAPEIQPARGLSGGGSSCLRVL